MTTLYLSIITYYIQLYNYATPLNPKHDGFPLNNPMTLTIDTSVISKPYIIPLCISFLSLILFWQVYRYYRILRTKQVTLFLDTEVTDDKASDTIKNLQLQFPLYQFKQVGPSTYAVSMSTHHWKVFLKQSREAAKASISGFFTSYNEDNILSDIKYNKDFSAFELYVTQKDFDEKKLELFISDVSRISDHMQGVHLIYPDERSLSLYIILTSTKETLYYGDMSLYKEEDYY